MPVTWPLVPRTCACINMWLSTQQQAVSTCVRRMQAALKMEAAVSCVEEQLKSKEAVDAENAAVTAKAAEDEAMVRLAHVWSSEPLNGCAEPGFAAHGLPRMDHHTFIQKRPRKWVGQN